MKYVSQLSHIYYRYQTIWLMIRSIWSALNRQSNLDALVRWATRKRLTTVRQAYQAQLHQVEDRLWYHQVRCPSLVIFCEFLFTAYKQIVPSHRYKRASAAKYRLAI